MKRLLPTLFLALLVLASAPVGARAEDDEDAPAVTPEARDAALKKAFGFLDENVWKMTDGGSPEKQYSVAVMGWAYLLAGERAGKRLPSRSRELKRIREYLEQYLGQVERVYDKDAGDRKPPRPIPGMPPGMSPDWLRTAQYAWPLSMAGLFYGESIRRGKERRGSRRVLKRIVKVLEAAQQPNGGWGHDDAKIPGFGVPAFPIPKPGGGTTTLNYPHTLLGATNCVAASLGTAHDVLGTKSPESIALAVKYYREAQSPVGNFPYDPSQKMPDMPAGMAGRIPMTLDNARTGGALLALRCMGVPADDETAKRAEAVVDAHLEDLSEGHGSAMMALQLGALVCRARGDETWEAFRRIYFPRIIASQSEDGAFDCVCKGEAPGVTCDTKSPGGMGNMPGLQDGKKVYVTAIHCLILLLDRTAAKVVPDMPGPKGPVTPR